MNTKQTKQGIRTANGTLTWESVSARLLGLPPLDRNADLSASGKRVKLPDPYFNPELGFPELLNGVDWLLTYLDEDLLVAVPVGLWPEFVERLRAELCRADGLSGNSFRKLHVDRAHRVRLDTRNRWRIHEHLAKHLHHDGNGDCPLVFQTREATIEIRTRSRHFKEQREAEIEAETLRLKTSALAFPADPGNEMSVPKASRRASPENLKS